METTTKYAVIIKHPYRDNDYRVDIVEVDNNVSPNDIRIVIERAMLGPFEILAITPKLDMKRDISERLFKLYADNGKHTET